MSFLSDWWNNTTIETIASIVLNLIFQLCDKEGDGIQIYINTAIGKYIVEFEKVDERVNDEEAIFNAFFAIKGIIVRISIYKNND